LIQIKRSSVIGPINGAQAMSDSNDNRYRIVSTGKLAVVAAVAVALIAGILIYARHNSGNDTSTAVTNTPPARP
jgi:hypothetical protein